MLEIPDDFEINRSVIKENSSFQELNTLLEETRNFMYEMSFLAYGRDNIVLHKVGVISGNQSVGPSGHEHPGYRPAIAGVP